MAAADDGGATSKVNSSSYGGGGAGGKFRKKLFRRQATPYDRPPAGLRGNSHKPEGWLKKLLVDPAYKLISYGADRLFDSVFRKRLLAPQSPREPDVNSNVNDAVQEAVVNDKEVTVEPAPTEDNHPRNWSSSNGLSELEQLLMRNTFTRSEISYLTKLMKSKEAEVCTGNSIKERVGHASDNRKHQVFFNGPVAENKNDGFRLSASMSTPLRQLKVPQDDIASPAELAKTYMGCRGSKFSPSMVGVQPQIPGEDSGLLNYSPLASKSPIVLTERNAVNFAAAENDYSTPRSQSRSAIYNMARTPYSRGYSSLKVNANSHTGAALSSSSSLYSKENSETCDLRSTNSKRRSSVLEDDIGSVGPVRRIRQKSNLLAPRIPHVSLGINSHAKQKSGLIVDPSNSISRNIRENEHQDTPSTSYARVPSRSSEVAAKILQQLEKLSPKEKLFESKNVIGPEKSQLRLTDSMLSGKALRSMENAGIPKMPLAFPDEQKSDMYSKSMADAHVDLQKPGNNVRNGLAESFYTSGTRSDSLLMSHARLADTGIENGSPEPSQKKRTFIMSAQEDSLKPGDGKPSSSSGVVEPSSSMKKHFPPEESRPSKSTNQQGFMPQLGLSFSKTRDFIASNASCSSEKSSVILPTKASNGSTPAFSFTAKVDDSSGSLPSEFTMRAASGPQTSTSLSATQLHASQVKNPEIENNIHPSLTTSGDSIVKSESVPPAVNGSFSFSPASSSDVTEKPTGNVLPSSTSTGSGDFFSKSATFSGTVFSLTVKPSSSSGLLPGAAAKPLTNKYPEVLGFNAKTEMQQSSASSSLPFTFPAVGPSSSKNATVGLDSNFSQSSAATLKSFHIADSSTTRLSTNGTSATFLPPPSFNVSGSSGLGFSTSSQPFNTSSFTSASSQDTTNALWGCTQSLNVPATEANAATVERTAAINGNGVAGSAVDFGISFSASSNCSAGSGSSSTTHSSSFAPLIGRPDSGISSNLLVFSFGATSSGSAAINGANSFSSGHSGMFAFGGSSSTAINPVSSSGATSNVFGSSWQAPKPPAFGTTFNSFGASSSLNPPIFNSSAGASAFTTIPASVASSPLPTVSQPIFGEPLASGFIASSENSDQMNLEDRMTEDPVQSSAPASSLFGQSSAPQATPGIGFGFAVPSQASPSVFCGQLNQAPLSSSPFQSSGSLDFNASGAFSMGSGGADKNRRIVRISKGKNRKN